MEAVARGRGPAGSGRQLLSPGMRARIGRGLGELGALALAMAGIALLVALVTYNPRDPSLNTATSEHASNLAGPVGALLADLLLQGFGLAGVLPGVAMLAWAARIAFGGRLGRVWLRLALIAAALPLLSVVFSTVSGGLMWPTGAGLGGAAGHVLVGAASGVVPGPFGVLLIFAGAVALALTLGWFGLGLGLPAWRAGMGGARVAAEALPRAGMVFTRAAPAAREPEAPATPIFMPPPFAPTNKGAAAPPPPAPPGAVHMPSPKPRVAMPERRAPAPRQESLPLVEESWRLPPVTLLKPPQHGVGAGASAESLEANARLLESVLADFGVHGAIRDIRPGPVVTMYELEPAPGIRSARVIGLADDVARSLSVTAVRIATVPGRNVIGIEVPNARRETVFLSELFEGDAWNRNPGRLLLALGKDIFGGPIVTDLARMPHLLIAGTTGSGKSVGINAMILSLLMRLPPDHCRLILIDPKMLELSVYEGIPHLMAPVVTEPAKAVSALKWTVREMERRYRLMSQLSVRNIGGFNDRVEDARARGEAITRRVQTGFDSETGKPHFEEQSLALENLPFIVVVIDEMADLMMVAGKEIEAAVQRLAQMARAAGIHVIMATQRPSVDVITGTIKANFPTRISFQVISKFDSRTILGEQGAEQLLGHGDMLWMAGGGRITRVHGPLVTDREVEDIVAYLRTQGEPAYMDEVTEPLEEESSANAGFNGIAGASDGEKGLFDQAVDLVSREGKASTSFIQRHLQIGYNRAAKLIEQMEKEGVVSAANHVGKREVLVRRRDED